VVEAALGHLPFSERIVSTPTGHPYVGVDFCKGVCGVSIIRSGEAMEAALRACCSGIKVGKLLVTRCVVSEPGWGWHMGTHGHDVDDVDVVDDRVVHCLGPDVALFGA
jgi:uracil phosphoribosyltransferase